MADTKKKKPVKKKKRRSANPKLDPKWNGKTPFVEGNKLGACPENTGRPEKWTKEILDQLAKKLEAWMQKPDSLYIKTFCFQENFLHSQGGEFALKSPEFSTVWGRTKSWQEQRLIQYALEKKTSDSFTKFLLINKHGFKEKTEISGNAASPFVVLLDRIGATATNPLDDYEDE